jgi:hypothetical protein
LFTYPATSPPRAVQLQRKTQLTVFKFTRSLQGSARPANGSWDQGNGQIRRGHAARYPGHRNTRARYRASTVPVEP